MLKTIGLAVFALTFAAWALMLGGCQPPVTVTTSYQSVSSHTLHVAADKEADVVWVQRIKDGEFILMRCYNASDTPTCVRAKTP